MKQIGRGRLFKKPLGLLVAVGLFLFIPIVATYADNVVQGYGYKGQLKIGEVVSLTSSKNSTVQASPGDRPELMYGVVVNPESAPIFLSGQGNQVYVTTGGTYPILVDTQNGPITKGDYLSISSTDGIAAKATQDQQYVVAQATESFDGSKSIGSIGPYQEGQINATIQVDLNKNYKNSLNVPQPLQKAFNAVAGKDVPPFKIYSALIILVIAATLTIVLLVVGIRSGMIAIGRNPLSRHYILEGLFQVIGAGLVIFITSLVGVYLLLKL